MTPLEQLRQATRRLAESERGQGHADHRYTHAPSECSLCAEWTLRVLDVAIAADRVLYPMLAVRDALPRP